MVDLTQDRLFYLKTGIIYRCVCAPKSWAPDKVADTVTSADPPGTSANQWVITDTSNRDDFEGKQPMQCSDDPERQHWILNC